MNQPVTQPHITGAPSTLSALHPVPHLRRLLMLLQIRKYEAQRGSNKSTYWVIFELIWRDYFRFYALKHGNAIFFEGGPAGGMLNWSSDPELFQRWCQGTTGMPLVDANMRELAATGGRRGHLTAAGVRFA